MKNVNRIAYKTRTAGGGEGGSAIPLDLGFPKVTSTLSQLIFEIS